MEWHSKDHDKLHVHVIEHSPFLALSGHVKLAHVLDSLVRARVEVFTCHGAGRLRTRATGTRVGFLGPCFKTGAHIQVLTFHGVFDIQRTVEAFGQLLKFIVAPATYPRLFEIAPL